MVVGIRVVVERGLRRSFVGPGLERRQVVEGRKVVASARATIFSIAFRCDRCASRLFAAGLLLVKDQIPQKKGMKGAKRLFGPAGDLARLPQRRLVIGREPTKRAMGDSVVASDEASYV